MTALDRFLVMLPGPQRLIHILKNYRITQTMNRSVRFGTVRWNTTRRTKRYYHMLKLPITKAFTALWHKVTNSSVKCWVRH